MGEDREGRRKEGYSVASRMGARTATRHPRCRGVPGVGTRRLSEERAAELHRNRKPCGERWGDGGRRRFTVTTGTRILRLIFGLLSPRRACDAPAAVACLREPRAAVPDPDMQGRTARAVRGDGRTTRRTSRRRPVWRRASGEATPRCTPVTWGQARQARSRSSRPC
jgi:hypothetical protein